MSRSRRKALIKIIAKGAPGLILLDAVLYFALVQPLEKRASEEQRRSVAASHRMQETQARVESLKKFQEALPEAAEQIKLFERKHVPPRRRAFSRAARLVRQLTQQSGLQLSDVAYKLDSSGDAPLQRLGIEIDVEGPFTGLFNFTHALETASDFIVVREFTFEPAERGSVALKLGADLYLAP